MGKSRLVYEFTHSHRLQGWLVLEAASVSYGKATSYLPVIDLLKGYFKIQDRDDPREIREKVTGKLLTLDRALEPLAARRCWRCSTCRSTTPLAGLDPAQRRQRTLDAVKRLLLRESQVQPLLVVFEDLHWIDGETQALLDSLVESLAYGAPAAPRELPPRVPARLGRARRTTPSSGSTPCRPRAPASCWRRSSATTPASRPLKQLLIERGATRSSWRRPCGRWSRRGRWRGARARIG